MSDLISRQSALYAIYGICNEPVAWLIRAAREIEKLPSAQPEERTEERTETHACDCISRQAAIDGADKIIERDTSDNNDVVKAMIAWKEWIKGLPSAQPTLYGYDIKHLMLIAEVLKKENLPPERITEALMDIGRIVSIVRDEFEESLREAMKQCKI